MELSNRSVNMPASPIRKLVPFADQAKEAGKTVYHLNIGQPDIETPKAVIDAMRSFCDPVLAYGPSQGLLSLRQAIVAYFANLGIDLTTDQVSVTEGGSEAVLFSYTVIADPGDEIIVFEPFYANYNGFASMLGINLTPVTLSPDECFELPSREVIESKITPKTRAMQICSPNNPTGKVLSKKDMDMLVDIAKKHDLFIVSDEVYREFSYGERPVSLLEYEDFKDNAIVVDSISKRFSACGARVGCVVSRNADVMAGVLKCAQARLCPATIEQLGAEAAYRMDPSYFEPTIKEYRLRRDTCVNALQKINGVVCPNPGGAFYILAKLPVSDSEAFARFMLTDFDVDGETVMVAPGPGFYYTEGFGSQEVRIAYVLNSEKLARSMEILERGIDAFNALTDNEATAGTESSSTA